MGNLWVQFNKPPQAGGLRPHAAGFATLTPPKFPFPDKRAREDKKNAQVISRQESQVSRGKMYCLPGTVEPLRSIGCPLFIRPKSFVSTIVSGKCLQCELPQRDNGEKNNYQPKLNFALKHDHLDLCRGCCAKANTRSSPAVSADRNTVIAIYRWCLGELTQQVSTLLTFTTKLAQKQPLPCYFHGVKLVQKLGLMNIKCNVSQDLAEEENSLQEIIRHLPFLPGEGNQIILKRKVHNYITDLKFDSNLINSKDGAVKESEKLKLCSEGTGWVYCHLGIDWTIRYENRPLRKHIWDMSNAIFVLKEVVVSPVDCIFGFLLLETLRVYKILRHAAASSAHCQQLGTLVIYNLRAYDTALSKLNGFSLQDPLRPMQKNKESSNKQEGLCKSSSATVEGHKIVSAA
ncbi:hypothetical protein GQR58_008642 [Nymphon striatum]|nr:hypothetical protein GQR58_008642 [Nymphon striatum]